jgi:prevent-host-death family protein
MALRGAPGERPTCTTCCRLAAGIAAGEIRRDGSRGAACVEPCPNRHATARAPVVSRGTALQRCLRAAGAVRGGRMRGRASARPPGRNVATCGYNQIMETGVRELKDNLSRYLRRMEAGERIVVTAHGRVVAELVPPAGGLHGRMSQFERLVASGVITPPVEDGDPLEDCPEIRLPPGTAAALIDSDRGET